MRALPIAHTSLLLSILTAGLLGAACGSASKPATTGPDQPGPDQPAEGKGGAVGTTGLAGLDWGANADVVLALYPRGAASDAGVTVLGMVDGHQAITVFTIGADGLSQVEIEWTEGFVSMEDCATGWQEARAKVDARLGPSQSDNLAAYWKTPTASITLACNPNDSNAGVLSQTFTRPTGD